MYGEQLLLQNVKDFSRERITCYRDSLVACGTVPSDFVDQINLFLRIRKMNDEQVVVLIDSLFDAENVPYPLINQINYYVATGGTFGERALDLWIDPDTSEYPCARFYPFWNTENPNPYSPSISAGDTTLELVLAGTEKLGEFVPPVVNTVTSRFGWRDGRPHRGIDLDLEVWDTVVTAFPGKVRIARSYGGYGRVVVVRHYNGLETLYAHLHRIKVKPGQELKAGDLVGLGGSSGHSTGSHLHFEARFKGVALNPESFIDFKTNTLKTDTLVLRKTSHGYAAFPKGATFYTVQKGDFLYRIAEQHGVSVSRLCEMNGIRRNSTLRVGQVLRVI